MPKKERSTVSIPQLPAEEGRRVSEELKKILSSCVLLEPSCPVAVVPVDSGNPINLVFLDGSASVATRAAVVAAAKQSEDED